MTIAIDLAANSIGIVWIDLDVDADQVTVLQRVLRPDEQDRVDRLSPLLQRRATVRLGQRRLILAQVCDVAPTELTIGHYPGGKPHAVASNGDNVEFSSSHCGDLGLIVVSRERIVGVDVESASELFDVPRITSWVATDLEAMQIDALPIERRPSTLLQLWTRKEAYLKATGEGIGNGVRNVRVPLGDVTNGQRFAPSSHGQEWMLYSLACPRVGLEASLVISSESEHETPSAIDLRHF
jgi:4'-phosphopantetheinyl transferase